MGFLDLATRRRRRMGSAAPSLSDQVQAILAGTTGFALDPSDLTTLDQVSGGGTPVTAPGDPVGRIASKWGTTTYNFLQATAGQRPAWNAGSLLGDGVDDFMASTDLQNWANSLPAVFVCARVQKPASAAVERTIFSANYAASVNNSKFRGRVDPSEVFILDGRRVVADATTAMNGSAMVSASPITVSALFDPNGAGTKQAWKGGVSEGAAVAFTTTGLYDAGASSRVRIFASPTTSTGSAFWSGNIGRMVWLPFAPSSGQRATIEAWVAEVAL